MKRFPLFLIAAAMIRCATPANQCEEAADIVYDCFGEELTECNDALANRIIGSTCGELISEADPEGKADGFCPRWLWWLCADGPVRECPSAGMSIDYGSFSSEERMNYHWEWAQCTEYGEGEVPELQRRTWDLVADAARGAVTSLPRLTRAFTNSEDEMDTGRVKLLHPYGSMVQLGWTPVEADASCDVPYTGVFAGGEQTVLARLSLAANPQVAGFFPGVALKFFVEGEDSVNYHAVRLPHDETNFFLQPVSNVLPEIPEGTSLRRVFDFLSRFVDDGTRMRLDHMASFAPDGTPVPQEEILSPFEMELVPRQEAYDLYAQALEANPEADFREVLEGIPVGTPLYDVFGIESEGACRQHLATLTTETRIVASFWSDRRLQFAHPMQDQGLE